MGLQAIVSDVAELIEPIALSCRLTLAVYDRTGQLLTVAGAEKQRVPRSQGDGSPAAHAVRTALNLVVERGREHDLCPSCPLAAGCGLSVEMFAPITDDQECVGALGAFCWDEAEGRELLGKRALIMQLMRQAARGISLRLATGQAPDRVIGLETCLRYVLDLNRDAAVLVNPELRIIAANSAAAARFNSTTDSLRLRPLAEVAPPGVIQVVSRGRAHRNLDEGGHRWEVRPIMSMDQVQGTVLWIRPLHEQTKRKSSVERRFGLEEIRGASDAIAAVKAKVRRIAPTETTVLIRGESGTGKELFARAIHWESNRRGGPFVALNCAAIPENLLESELFGYEDGAFTGARKGGKPGKFELGTGGTLLLDEVGDLPVYLQAKLLRVLQFKEVERVGGTEPIPVDFRLIAATNRPLEEMIAAGTFREDLYYRLSVIPLELPPLRDRKEDIPLLLEYTTKRMAHRGGYRPKRWSAEALNAIYAYHWPGNVRELENAVEHAVSVEEGDLIAGENLPPRMLAALGLRRKAEDAERAAAEPRPEPIPEVAPAPDLLVHTPSFPEARLSQTPVRDAWSENSAEKAAAQDPRTAALLEALNRFGRTTQGKDQAARALGISRATLYRRLKALQIQ